MVTTNPTIIASKFEDVTIHNASAYFALHRAAAPKTSAYSGWEVTLANKFGQHKGILVPNSKGFYDTKIAMEIHTSIWEQKEYPALFFMRKNDRLHEEVDSEFRRREGRSYDGKVVSPILWITAEDGIRYLGKPVFTYVDVKKGVVGGIPLFDLAMDERPRHASDSYLGIGCIEQKVGRSSVIKRILLKGATPEDKGTILLEARIENFDDHNIIVRR